MEYLAKRLDRQEDALIRIEDKLDRRLRAVEHRIWWFSGAFTLAQIGLGVWLSVRL